MNKFIRILKNPKKIIIKLASKGIIPYDDRKYIEFEYEEKNNEKLNLDNPRTFNEKLQWLKLYNHEDIYTNMVDKYGVRKIIKEKIGEEFLIPLLGVYDKFDDINFDKLPKQFVIKTTHDSGTCIICKNKKNFNILKAKKLINKRLKRKYYYLHREWPYKNVKPRIVVEKFIKDDLLDDLRDYKFMCFNGEPKYVYVTVKNDNIFENYYDMNFNPVNINHGFPRYHEEFEKPKKFKNMVEIAKTLSKGIPFVRVDLHFVNGNIYFGEMTFYDWAGNKKFLDSNTDLEMGRLIKL